MRICNTARRGMLMAIACGTFVLLCSSDLLAAQKTFKSPVDAFKALVGALEKADEKALIEILGHEHMDLITPADKAAAQQRRKEFVGQFKEHSRVVIKDEDTRATLIVGKLGWPMPIPAVKEKDEWRLDTAAGKEEILNRRIGENEIKIMEFLRAYVTAQRQYAKEDRDGDEVLEYAQKLKSSDGKKDGLYWPVPRGEWESPLGFIAAENAKYLEVREKGDPYWGYRGKILTAQGGNVPGGSYKYVINGNMIAGFGAVVWPAQYGTSGIMTFMVNHRGEIHEKDLGPKTAEEAAKIKAYNPDKSWELVEED